MRFYVGKRIFFIDAKNTTTLQFMRIIKTKMIFLAYCRHSTLFYQFPFAVQTHAFLRSIYRRLHFVKKYTKTDTYT